MQGHIVFCKVRWHGTGYGVHPPNWQQVSVLRVSEHISSHFADAFPSFGRTFVAVHGRITRYSLSLDVVGILTISERMATVGIGSIDIERTIWLSLARVKGLEHTISKQFV